MQGRLGDKLFPDLIRDLSREDATGRLTITHDGERIEVFFESGVPIQATSTPPDEQIATRVERDNVGGVKQINAAGLAPGESLRTTDPVMDEGGAPGAETSQQTQSDLSRRAIHSAFEWYTGDYEFIAVTDAPPGAKLTWTAAECVLSGARKASASETIVDVIAPDYKVVAPSPDTGDSIIQTATLSSVEGYVLSCIQSPVTIWEASSITGLSHIETRSALFVLMLLGLLVEERGSSGHLAGAQNGVEYQTRSAEDAVPAEQIGAECDQESPAQADTNAALVETTSTSPEPERPTLLAADDPAEPIQWCPVGYASSEPDKHARFASEEIEASTRRNSESPVASLTCEEALYQQKLFLEERLQKDAPLEVAPTSTDSGDRAEKSLTAAIQELNLKLRLASFAAQPPALPDNSEMARTTDPELAAVTTDPGAPLTAPQPISADQTPCPPQGLQATASLPRSDNGDERFLKKVIGKVEGRLAAAMSSDYYGVLGIDRLASNGSITRSYEELVALYAGYSSRWPEDGELQSRITELMARIKKAYEVLGNVETRRVYDMPPTDEEARSTARIEQRPATQEPRSSNQPERPTVDVQQGNDGGKLRPRRNKPAPVPSTSSAGRNRRAADREGEEGGFQPDLRNPYEAAEKYYKRGRAAYERSDLQGAVHLLREAIKLDPDRSSYYYQLGLVLSTLSQARKEHKHHKGCHVTCRLGGFLARNQRVRRDAERNLLKAAELDPANSDIKLKLGMLYKEAALDQKAQQYFYEALTIDANCELAKLELGLDREQGPVKVIEPGKKKSRRRPGKK